MPKETKREMTIALCRARLLRELKEDRILLFFCSIPCTVVAIALLIPYNRYLVDTVRGTVSYGFAEVWQLIGLILGELIFLALGAIGGLIFVRDYLEWHRLKHCTLRVEELEVLDVGRMPVRSYGKYRTEIWVPYLHFEKYGRYRIAESSVDFYAERGERYYVVLMPQKGKEKICAIYSTKIYAWVD